MATTSFTLDGIPMSDSIVYTLVELLRPEALRLTGEFMQSVKRDTGIPSELRNMYVEQAEIDVAAGGAFHWTKWEATDAEGIFRTLRSGDPLEGIPDTRPPLAGATSSLVEMQVGSFMERFTISMSTLGHTVTVGIDASDGQIRGLRSLVLDLLQQKIDADLLPAPPAFKVFIGHGGDPQWKYLHRALNDTHGIVAEAFESSERSGYHTLVVIDQMVRSSAVAVVVMTGEDQMGDGQLRARENVVHEVGFCQGALGIENTIVVLESGVSEPSNIAGLTQIRFSKGNLIEVEGKIVEALEQRRRAFAYEQS